MKEYHDTRGLSLGNAPSEEVESFSDDEETLRARSERLPSPLNIRHRGVSKCPPIHEHNDWKVGNEREELLRDKCAANLTLFQPVLDTNEVEIGWDENNCTRTLDGRLENRWEELATRKTSLTA